MATVTRCDGCGKLSDDKHHDNWIVIDVALRYSNGIGDLVDTDVTKDVCSRQCARQVVKEALDKLPQRIREHTSHA